MILVKTSKTTKNKLSRLKVDYKETEYTDTYNNFPFNITYRIEKVLNAACIYYFND